MSVRAPWATLPWAGFPTTKIAGGAGKVGAGAASSSVLDSEKSLAYNRIIWTLWARQQQERRTLTETLTARREIEAETTVRLFEQWQRKQEEEMTAFLL